MSTAKIAASETRQPIKTRAGETYRTPNHRRMSMDNRAATLPRTPLTSEYRTRSAFSKTHLAFGNVQLASSANGPTSRPHPADQHQRGRDYEHGTATSSTARAETALGAALTAEMMMTMPTAIEARRMAGGRAPEVRRANSATAASSTSAKTFPTTEFPMAATADQRDE